jgi:quinoprotein glucose dehydrogenase
MIERSDESALRAETGQQRGTPYVMKRDYLLKRVPGALLMQVKPPWGTLAAMDLNTGAKRWEVPLGYMLNPDKYPGAEKWGSLNLGGAIVTAGNLIFVAASLDGHFRAFDRRTGAILWEYALPAGGHATPMTYSLDGKQYVVIAAGGHGKLQTGEGEHLTKLGDYVIAFSIK